MMAWGEAGVILFQHQGNSEEEGRVDRSPEVSVGLSTVSAHAIWGYSVTTPVCAKTQRHTCSCVTAAQTLLPWESQYGYALVSVPSDVPVLNSAQKEKDSCPFQPAAATTAFLWPKTVLKEKVFAKKLDFCLFVGFVPLLKKEGLELAVFMLLISQHQLLFLRKDPRVIILVLLCGLPSFVFSYYHNLIHVADAVKG